MNNNFLSDDEQRIFSKKKFEIYESLDSNHYILHSKYPGEDDRYKLEQCKNGMSRLITIHKESLENSDLQIGDILKKENGKYIRDVEKTNEIHNLLEKVKQEIIESRN